MLSTLRPGCARNYALLADAWLGLNEPQHALLLAEQVLAAVRAKGSRCGALCRRTACACNVNRGQQGWQHLNAKHLCVCFGSCAWSLLCQLQPCATGGGLAVMWTFYLLAPMTLTCYAVLPASHGGG